VLEESDLELIVVESVIVPCPKYSDCHQDTATERIELLRRAFVSLSIERDCIVWTARVLLRRWAAIAPSPLLAFDFLA
jgi:hypothetical protein